MIPSVSIAVRSPTFWLALFVVVLCVALQYLGLTETWRFDRQRIESGSWYLLLTGNFVHLGLGHLWMNMAGFALIVVLVWQHFNLLEWVTVIVFSSLVVGVGLYLRDPHVGIYYGFSGTLHGVILAGCLADLRHYPKSAGLLLALVIGKLAWEQIAGPLPGSEETAGGSVIVNSHLYGAIGGAIIAVLLLAIRAMRSPKNVAPSHTPP